MTEYISSLKEDGELDALIQNILRAYQFEIISKTERGRQYGVDVYAVGKDFDDNNKKKVFLITVKQGDIDRNAWNSSQNSVEQSLDEIRTVFVRNNLAPQHRRLPIKIVVASNGQIKQSVQQNWTGYCEQYPAFEYAYWGIDFLVNHFENKLLNEAAFPAEIRSLVRKTIIHLDNPDYDLSHYSQLLTLSIERFHATKSKKEKLKGLKQVGLIFSIITKYCEEAGNMKHAVKCAEKYLLALWPALSAFDNDADYVRELVNALHFQLQILNKYVEKIAPVTIVKDGFSRWLRDQISYTYLVYEQLGIIALCGLYHVQLAEHLSSASNPEVQALATANMRQASGVCDVAISLVNHNGIIFSPRADDQIIEINLLLILLYKCGRKQDIQTLLQEYIGQMAEGISFSNTFPVFSNSKREIVELEIDYNKRNQHQYNSSILLAVLCEWTVVIGDAKLYDMVRHVKEKLLPALDLILWFPDEKTEALLYTEEATSNSGYSLSGIELPLDFHEFARITKTDFESNCKEKEFSFMKTSFWTLGLVASRHFRTYTFPFYWRQFIA